MGNDNIDDPIHPALKDYQRIEIDPEKEKENRAKLHKMMQNSRQDTIRRKRKQNE